MYSIFKKSLVVYYFFFLVLHCIFNLAVSNKSLLCIEDICGIISTTLSCNIRRNNASSFIVIKLNNQVIWFHHHACNRNQMAKPCTFYQKIYFVYSHNYLIILPKLLSQFTLCIYLLLLKNLRWRCNEFWSP